MNLVVCMCVLRIQSTHSHIHTDCHKAVQDAMLRSHLFSFYTDVPFKMVSYVLLCLPKAASVCMDKFAITPHTSPDQVNGKIEILQTAVYDKNEDKPCSSKKMTYCNFCQISIKPFFRVHLQKEIAWAKSWISQYPTLLCLSFCFILFFKAQLFLSSGP